MLIKIALPYSYLNKEIDFNPLKLNKKIGNALFWWPQIRKPYKIPKDLFRASFRLEHLLKITCLTMKFLNCNHANPYVDTTNYKKKTLVLYRFPRTMKK